MLKLQKLDKFETKLLFDFEKEVFSDNYSLLSCEQELLNEHKEYYVIRENNIAVAYCGIMKILDEAEILRIAVRKIFQHKGYGKKILTEIIAKLKKEKLKKIFLEVSESNLNAIKLYEKLDFKVVSKRLNYYKNGDTAIIMERGLIES